MKPFILVSALLLGACISSGASWSASTWDGLVPQTIATQNYAFMAAPMAGQGFKLKLTVKTDGSFGVAGVTPGVLGGTHLGDQFGVALVLVGLGGQVLPD